VLGGQKAILWTDVVQGVAFVLAVFVPVPLAISPAGGSSEITATVSEEQPSHFSPTGRVMSAISTASLFFIFERLRRRVEASGESSRAGATEMERQTP
jgi:Na+/proline symporter